VLNEKEAALSLGLSVTTLRSWRCRQKGPRFHKLGGAVRYDEREIAQFLSESLHEPVFRAGS
jgi:predicted DNA-binding transcriptional regulator AlpA